MKEYNMKSKVLMLVAGLLAASLTACSDMDQNPLAGYGEAIENAAPPSTKPDIPEPLKSEALRIDGPEVYSFLEGVAGSVKFSLRSLDPSYAGSITISNLNAFPGAVFNERTGEFSWTPAQGTVFTGFYQQFSLIVEAYAESAKAGSIPLVTQKEVTLIVQKVAKNPVIKSVEVRDPLLREGGTHFIRVLVMDPEGTNVDSERPRLILNSANTKVSLVPFITEYGNRGDLGRREWTIDLKVNLVGAELTDSVVSSFFDLQALNRYGLFSAPVRVTTNVATDFGSIETSLEGMMEVLKGQKNVMPFSVFDPKGEAKISVKSMRGVPAKAELKCNDSNRASMLKCRLVWTPDQKDTLATHNISMDIEMRNRNSADLKTVVRTVSFQVSTVEAPVDSLPSPFPVEGANND